jgi:hypothetical protein
MSLRRTSLTTCAIALAGSFAMDTASAQSAPWFRANFENLNERGTNMYNFGNRYAQSTTTWQVAHTTNEGWNGSAAPRVTIHGCSGGAGCNLSEHQFNAGWQTPSLGGTRAMGSPVFVRYRIKFDPDTRFPQGGFRVKFIMMGSTGTSPNSRWIIHLLTPHDNQGCSLAFDSYGSMGWQPSSSTTWWQGSQFGLPAEFGSSSLQDRYAGFQSSVNIGWSCAPAVLVAPSNHPSPVPKPQMRGERSTDGWYHLQFEAVPGNNGQADFRIWANNNAQSSPSSEHRDMADGLGITNWTGPVDVGGYWQTAFPGQIRFLIDDFEVGPSFDPAWYPGSSGPQPRPPSGTSAQ